METITALLSRELGQKEEYVENVVRLLDEGNTIPFIARYRKELHGAMDDTVLRTLETRLQYLRGLQERRETVLAAIGEQGKLTEELSAAIERAATLAELEDLYRPYKPKRRTRATIAKEKGLEPLAELLFAQKRDCPEPLEEAAKYVSEEKSVLTAEEALAGANDIVAERISDDAALRKRLRELLHRSGVLRSKAAGEEDSVYRLYYDFAQPISRLQGHQVLAVNRGEKEGFLKVSVELERDRALQTVNRAVVVPGTRAMGFVRTAAEDAYDRLLFPSLEREIRSDLTDTACTGAIGQFATNLRALLMQPPVKGKVTMGLDPGYRMGCKVAVVDGTGKVLDTAVVYPTYGERQKREAIAALSALVRRHGVEHIAIGNGTASRETKDFVEDCLRNPSTTSKTRDTRDTSTPALFVVSEDGASVYSASKTARDEFPDEDVTVRGAVSIGRRLMDPLAELVKIDPKSIGVGQYQHDVDQFMLKHSLDQTVESCVNLVGVNLNTASQHLLTYVSGLGPVLAQNIVDYRRQNGAFTSRAQLKKVPRLGPAAFQQCAGFLRIPGAKNPLDNSAVHPESYHVVEQMAKDQHCTVSDLINNKETRDRIDIHRYVTDAVGLPTLTDIMHELEKPGRDPREQIEEFEFDSSVQTVDDLREGMILPGIVTNITNFGAFVDIGVHQDGLVHVSQLADRYVTDPTQVVRLHQHVQVRVIAVDLRRQRISLSMKGMKKPQRVDSTR